MANLRLGGVDRRRFVLATAGSVAGAGVASLAWPSSSEAAVSRSSKRPIPPAPNPIPGGIELAPGVVIHVFGAGDPSVTLPFSGLTLQGFDVEPTTITDFSGSAALAFHAGTAQGSDGNTYNLETDIRAYEGEYIVNGVTHRASFAFV